MCAEVMCFHCPFWIMGVHVKTAEVLVDSIDRCETAVSLVLVAIGDGRYLI
jgi:hypothetical protein